MSTLPDDRPPATALLISGGWQPFSTLPSQSIGDSFWKLWHCHPRIRIIVYRAVYAVRFEHAIYVLHCFQKKSPTGIKTARMDIELVHKRLAAAGADYKARYGQEQK